MEPLRIGVLGAARISELSIVAPAMATGHRLVAIAARSPERARAFAEQHGVERVHATYEDLLADPEIEVVYNPLPNSLHAPWNLRALAAGKHVLSEKPSASNADEAALVTAAAADSGRVFMEAFHYPFHPLFRRVLELLVEAAVGTLQHIEAPMRMPAPPDDDPRWNASLSGGSTMDLGCYSLHAARMLGRYAGGEPSVVRAAAGERAGHPGVDEWLTAELVYPSGATASVGSHMAADDVDFHLTITGDAGRLQVPEFARPHVDGSLQVERHGQATVREDLGRRSSYTYQLEALAAHLRDGFPLALGARDAEANMRLIDAAYQAAGLEPRAAQMG